MYEYWLISAMYYIVLEKLNLPDLLQYTLNSLFIFGFSIGCAFSIHVSILLILWMLYNVGLLNNTINSHNEKRNYIIILILNKHLLAEKLGWFGAKIKHYKYLFHWLPEPPYAQYPHCTKLAKISCNYIYLIIMLRLTKKAKQDLPIPYVKQYRGFVWSHTCTMYIYLHFVHFVYIVLFLLIFFNWAI